MAKSKLASGSGTSSALPCSSGNSMPNCCWKPRAVSSCASELSIPMTRAPRRAIHEDT
jgi:hypothetical protein